MSLPGGIDLGADGAGFDETDALDAAVADGRAQFVGDRRDGEDVIGIGHSRSSGAPAVVRKVDASDEDRA